ncbi:MAG: hypothetical protein MZV64_31685, partial [Ignavibacteriales bacterium]|nr:hypothetical protein [Ignavibacteriales bacterium]
SYVLLRLNRRLQTESTAPGPGTAAGTPRGDRGPLVHHKTLRGYIIHTLYHGARLHWPRSKPPAPEETSLTRAALFL